MPILGRQGDDDEHDEAGLSAGARPFDALDFDPNDPDQVKVHYDLRAWSFEQRAEVSETLAERGLPHAWAGDELIVPEEVEAEVDDLFVELEAELGPFPVMLTTEDEDGITAFELDEWPDGDLELLRQSLVEAEIPHRWEGDTLVVARDAEHAVDELLDAIETGEVASLDEAAEAPDGALHQLYVAADRLHRDAGDGAARASIMGLVPDLSPTAPPFGLAMRAWGLIVDRARALTAEFEAGGEPGSIVAAADELRDVCRPYV